MYMPIQGARVYVYLEGIRITSSCQMTVATVKGRLVKACNRSKFTFECGELVLDCSLFVKILQLAGQLETLKNPTQLWSGHSLRSRISQTQTSSLWAVQLTTRSMLLSARLTRGTCFLPQLITSSPLPTLLVFVPSALCYKSPAYDKALTLYTC